MKIAAYLRVSTDRQAEKGLGVEVQRDTIKAWAKRNGHKVVGYFEDLGVSGSNGLDTRDGLPEALAAIRGGSAQGLVVYKLDRLARDLVLQETLLAEVKRLGGEVFSTSAAESGYLTDDPDDPSRALIRQILGAVSQYEKSMIALRLRSGRRRKAQNGGYAYGAPGLGFRAEDGALVADEGESATIELIMSLHRQGKSTRQIVAVLTEKGHRTKRGGLWHPATVARVVNRSR